MLPDGRAKEGGGVVAAVASVSQHVPWKEHGSNFDPIVF